MKQKTTLIILAVILIFLVLFNVLIKTDKGQGVIKSINNNSIEFLNRTTGIFSNIDNFILTYQENIVIEDLNKQLSEQVSNLENEIKLLKEENEYIKNEISTSANYSEKEYAEVIYRGNATWDEYIVINKGVDDGIEVGDVVTSQGYLVGVVTETLPKESTVELYTSQENLSQISASVDSNQEKIPGTVSSYDQYANMFTFSPFYETENVKLGDTVYTTGQDGTFPAGIKIGVVTNITINDETNKLNIDVTPGISYSNIEYVTVIK